MAKHNELVPDRIAPVWPRARSRSGSVRPAGADGAAAIKKECSLAAHWLATATGQPLPNPPPPPAACVVA